FDFFVTGMFEGSLSEELAIWNQKLSDYSGQSFPVAKSWTESFSQLKKYIQTLTKERIVVFIDELPWLDTPRSKFVKAFEQFWNDWASTQDNLMIIVCGSATTWMNDNIISQKGGLYNRVTRKIKLSPFTLRETSQFLESKNIKWSNHQIDMIIERLNQVINVCEAKFTTSPCVLTEKYLLELNERIEDFRSSVKTNYAIHLTLIASSGLANNEYSHQVRSVVTLKDLMGNI
ncbi:MAG: ATP-binding protein, partial [Candidatus Cryptobacteroides sp.]